MKRNLQLTSPLALSVLLAFSLSELTTAKLADRSRLVKYRQESGKISGYHDNGRPIEGQSYRSRSKDVEVDTSRKNMQQKDAVYKPAPWKMEGISKFKDDNTPRIGDTTPVSENIRGSSNKFSSEQQQTPEEFERELSSQLSGCCYTHKSYTAASLCMLYGNDCESGETPSHDSGDESCQQEGLSFIGLSFSVNTASGNPYSYQLCDQFPMENIIDRNYNYVMSMDEDGWLVGGGYKTFDYSGKMP
jgi:hypothetical protein